MHVGSTFASSQALARMGWVCYLLYGSHLLWTGGGGGEFWSHASVEVVLLLGLPSLPTGSLYMCGRGWHQRAVAGSANIDWLYCVCHSSAVGV